MKDCRIFVKDRVYFVKDRRISQTRLGLIRPPVGLLRVSERGEK